MRMTTVSFGLALFVALWVAGCGPDVKKENDQLRTQVGSLQKENLTLKGDATSLRADVDAMKKELESLRQEKQTLENAVKELEAKIAAKPTTRPPVKPKRMSPS